MTSIDNLADEIMKGLTEYVDLAEADMKKAVKKTATAVKKDIAANAPKRTGKYAASWTTKKTKENSHSLEMTVHSKDRYQLAHLLEKGHTEASGLDIESLEVFENIAYVMAKHASPESVPDNPDDFLEQFNTFSIYESLPQLIELWGLNTATQVESKKNIARLTAR